MLKPFHVKIKVYSEHKTNEIYEEYGVERASLEEVITTCKIISIHMAQREDTYHLINRELLKKIPDGSILINTSRGALIDEEALADELSTGRFKAALDVYEIEPLLKESRLRGFNNVILIPHMGGPTIDRRKSCTHGILDDIERFYKEFEIVDKEAAYILPAKAMAMTIIDLLYNEAREGIRIKEDFEPMNSKDEYLKIWEEFLTSKEYLI